jgi:hypothetical protein
MATVIKASCHDCGDVELGVSELHVRVCTTAETPGSYVFRCPSCQMSVTKPAEQRIVDLLVASGVEVVEWRLPAELFEARSGAAITHDDLIDFHRILQTDDWFDAVVAMGQPS